MEITNDAPGNPPRFCIASASRISSIPHAGSRLMRPRSSRTCVRTCWSPGSRSMTAAMPLAAHGSAVHEFTDAAWVAGSMLASIKPA